jgi:hypothetical protein
MALEEDYIRAPSDWNPDILSFFYLPLRSSAHEAEEEHIKREYWPEKANVIRQG